MKLKVTNIITGKIWVEENSNHSWQELALEIIKSQGKHNSCLVYCDIEGLAEMSSVWYILDECGNWEYVPENYKIEEVKCPPKEK